MVNDTIKITVDGPPVTAEVTLEQVREYMRAKGWSPLNDSHEVWCCPISPPCRVHLHPQRGTAIITEIAAHDKRHPSEVLREIAGEVEPTPIDMILPCPRCGMLHVDAPEPDKGWTNPPHKSHLCHGCGCIWRPASVSTNGVASVPPGKADTWKPGRAALAEALGAAVLGKREVEERADERLPHVVHEGRIETAIGMFSPCHRGWYELSQEQRDRIWGALRWLVDVTQGVAVAEPFGHMNDAGAIEPSPTRAELLAAVVDALPRCHACTSIATKRSDQRPSRYCDEHAPRPYEATGGQCVSWHDLPYAAALRDIAKGTRAKTPGEARADETGYTRAQLAAAVDEAHAALHDAEEVSRAERVHGEWLLLGERLLLILGHVARAHDALHRVGAGVPRVGCTTPDHEAQLAQ